MLGLLAFATLWLGVGLLGQLVWLPWLLIPRRLLLWPLAGLLLLPWFLALYWTQYNAASETARGRALPGSWPFALSGALFTGWLLLTVFPLQ